MDCESSIGHENEGSMTTSIHEKRPDYQEACLVESKSQPELTGGKRAIAVIAILSSTFLYAFDNTVMANVRPSIVHSLGHIEMLPWLSVSYPLGEVGSNPIWGKLFAQFDNKKLYLFAVLIFEIGSAIIGSAQTIQVLILGRVISGLGGSGIYVGTVGIISAMTSIQERAQYLAFVGIAWSLGTILGPVIGGALADSPATWRWAFYINICIAGLFVPIFMVLIPSFPPLVNYKAFERLRRFDYVGAILFLAGVLTINMVLTLGGTLYSWKSDAMIILYVFIPIIWVAFGLQQSYSFLTVDRIFPVDLVKNVTMINMFSWTAIAISNLVVTIYSLPLLFQFAFGDSSLRAAIFMLPFMSTIIVSAGAGGALLPKYPVYMAWFLGCSILMVTGSALLSTINDKTSRGAICGFSVIQAAGVGAVGQLGYTVAQSKVGKHQVQQVAAFMSCAQMGGLCLSLGISTCIFMNITTNDIVAILPNVSRATVQAALGGLSSDNFIQDLSLSTVEKIIAVIARNLGRVFYMNIAGAALGVVTALMMKVEKVKFDDCPNN